jgi:hypothetical protein
LLATRPIFHKTDAAIRGHVFCSFLAVLLRKELFDRIAAHGSKRLEWRHIVDELMDLSEVEVEQDGRGLPGAAANRDPTLITVAPGAAARPLTH